MTGYTPISFRENGSFNKISILRKSQTNDLANRFTSLSMWHWPLTRIGTDFGHKLQSVQNSLVLLRERPLSQDFCTQRHLFSGSRFVFAAITSSLSQESGQKPLFEHDFRSKICLKTLMFNSGTDLSQTRDHGFAPIQSATTR